MTKLFSFFSADTLQGLQDNIRSLQDNRPLMVALRVLQVIFVLGMFIYLGFRLSEIGWTDVLDALPASPLYYLFFLGWYFAMPLAELSVYRLMWGMSLARHLGVFLRKRVYNKAIFNYTGEAYLAIWAHRTLPLRGRAVIATVKDSNLLSGLASNSTTLLFLTLAWFSGGLAPILDTNPDLGESILFAAVVAGFLVPMVARFRHKIIGLPTPLMAKVLSIHALRNVAEVVFQAGMWMVVLPELPISVWIVLLSAQLVLTRIPLPNTDLMLVGLGLSLSGLIDAPEAVIAGMFLAAGALNQLLNGVIYMGTSVQAFIGNERKRAKTANSQPNPVSSGSSPDKAA